MFVGRTPHFIVCDRLRQVTGKSSCTFEDVVKRAEECFECFPNSITLWSILCKWAVTDFKRRHSSNGLILRKDCIIPDYYNDIIDDERSASGTTRVLAIFERALNCCPSYSICVIITEFASEFLNLHDCYTWYDKVISACKHDPRLTEFIYPVLLFCSRLHNIITLTIHKQTTIASAAAAAAAALDTDGLDSTDINPDLPNLEARDQSTSALPLVDGVALLVDPLSQNFLPTQAENGGEMVMYQRITHFLMQSSGLANSSNAAAAAAAAIGIREEGEIKKDGAEEKANLKPFHFGHPIDVNRIRLLYKIWQESVPAEQTDLHRQYVAAERALLFSDTTDLLNKIITSAETVNTIFSEVGPSLRRLFLAADGLLGGPELISRDTARTEGKRLEHWRSVLIIETKNPFKLNIQSYISRVTWIFQQALLHSATHAVLWVAFAQWVQSFGMQEVADKILQRARAQLPTDDLIAITAAAMEERHGRPFAGLRTLSANIRMIAAEETPDSNQNSMSACSSQLLALLGHLRRSMGILSSRQLVANLLAEHPLRPQVNPSFLMGVVLMEVRSSDSSRSEIHTVLESLLETGRNLWPRCLRLLIEFALSFGRFGMGSISISLMSEITDLYNEVLRLVETEHIPANEVITCQCCSDSYVRGSSIPISEDVDVLVKYRMLYARALREVAIYCANQTIATNMITQAEQMERIFDELDSASRIIEDAAMDVVLSKFGGKVALNMRASIASSCMRAGGVFSNLRRSPLVSIAEEIQLADQRNIILKNASKNINLKKTEDEEEDEEDNHGNIAVDDPLVPMGDEELVVNGVTIPNINLLLDIDDFVNPMALLARPLPGGPAPERAIVPPPFTAADTLGKPYASGTVPAVILRTLEALKQYGAVPRPPSNMKAGWLVDFTLKQLVNYRVSEEKTEHV